MKFKNLLLALLLAFSGTYAFSQKVVQIDIKNLLNARIVTTWSNGKLVTWTDALDNGSSGEATRTAADKMGNSTALALPDDGIFPANDKHPLVKLNFSNSETSGNQVHRSIGVDSFLVKVPKAKYTKIWMFYMSGNGNSALKVKLKYADGTIETREIEVPDWYFPVPENETKRCNLAVNLGKWGNDNKMMEADHHYITGIDAQPNPAKALTEVSVIKSQQGVLTLWGVTGVQ